MRVSNVMQGHAATVGPKTDLALAGRRMKAVGCGALPVVERGNRVIGLVTDRDLLLALAELDRQPSTMTVGEMMGNDLFTCHPEDGLDSALQSMRHHKVRRLMVTDRAKRLLGILCLDDIVLYTRPTHRDPAGDLRAPAAGRPSVVSRGVVSHLPVWGGATLPAGEPPHPHR
jgi:CBS domain-containing protein